MTLQTLDQLRRQRAELPGVMEEVMQQFIADAPRQIELIESAYQAADADALRQNSHFLRSGALALRLEWLAEQAHRLEFLASEDFGKESSDRLLNNLKTELDGVVVALLKELEHGA
jgi:HPt (histidine-containing phosphotransfer) domain-containing protein